ncbi:MAG: TonB-dependent receptor [Fusobacterium sp.]|uniref:TonB-dependent receptor n=1 Tax=Fusobacterium sp. TaxID=68766 RepID=UPI0029431E61|nr:TonB-dependent receptor [Fusobacterium sp.]MDY3059861.1 TonB-dependent receptor [Fusobacterium sp.]
MKKYLMLAAILAVGTTAMAEEKIASQKLNETVISTENFETSVLDTAKNITIVTQEEIQAKGANTVAEALRGVPGLTISTLDGGEPAFDLRGYGATAYQNTLILIDGIPLNNIQGSGYYTSQIPVNMIDKIEIIPSGGAVMYGEGAAGGIINIITKTLQDKKNYGSVGLEVGSWGTTKGSLNYGTKITDRFLMDIAYTNYKSEGYRSKTKGDNHEKFDKDDKKEAIWLRGKYLLDNGSIEASYRHNELEDYYTGPLNKKQFEKDPSMAGDYNGICDSTEDSYTLRYNQKINDKVDFLVYGGYEELEFKGDDSKYFWKNHYLASQYFIKPQIKYSYGENSYIILGGDYRDGKSENQLDKTAKDKTRESYAGYILNKTTLGNWQFTQGYRREKIELDDGSIPKKENKNDVNSYELGINHLYSDTGSIYLSYVKGFRSPSIQDMGYWDGREYKVQETETYEFGLKDMYKNTYISASVFLMNTENEIYFDGLGEIKKNKNFDGEIERRGAQLSLNHYFDKLILREGISFIESEIKDGLAKNNEFPGVPKWTVNLGATYNFTEKLIGNIDMYYQSAAYGSSDFANKDGKNNEYTTVDTNLTYKFNDGLEIYGGVKNLFDEEYCNAIVNGGYNPADGRSYYAGFRYNF